LVPSYAVLSFVLAAVYEIALDWTSLGSFILVAPRTNLFSQNREGIFSFFGYLAIFLAGQSLGASALPRQQPIAKNASIQTKLQQSTFGKLIMTSVFWTVLFYFSTSYYGLRLPVSRRLANLPYFLWVSSFNSYQITICYAIESFLFPNLYKATTKEEESRRSRDATSTVLYAYNRNGLAVFLVANLLTGLVNMTFPTLHMGVFQSMGILVAYIATVTAVAVGLDMYNLTIKL
jgi:phosphatidylinositol glycan class W